MQPAPNKNLTRADREAVAMLRKSAGTPAKQRVQALKKVLAGFQRLQSRFGNEQAVAVLGSAIRQAPGDIDPALAYGMSEGYLQLRCSLSKNPPDFFAL